MKIALAQLSASDDPRANVARGLEMMERAHEAGARLIVFPELSFTRFFPQRKGARPEAEPIPGPTTERFAEAAKRCGMVTVINLYERDGEAAYDASPVIDADGTLRGVTRMAHIADTKGFYEKDYYRAGALPPPVHETSVGKVGVAICYDRHFPEYMRSLAGADLVVIPQAGVAGEWPDGLFEAEVRVAAFQNGYFAALANRVGREGDLDFEGCSFVADPFGTVVAQAPAGRDHLLTADLDFARLAECPARSRFLPDRRR